MAHTFVGKGKGRAFPPVPPVAGRKRRAFSPLEDEDASDTDLDGRNKRRKRYDNEDAGLAGGNDGE
jgi:hypothetical protein